MFGHNIELPTLIQKELSLGSEIYKKRNLKHMLRILN